MLIMYVYLCAYVYIKKIGVTSCDMDSEKQDMLLKMPYVYLTTVISQVIQ